MSCDAVEMGIGIDIGGGAASGPACICGGIRGTGGICAPGGAWNGIRGKKGGWCIGGIGGIPGSGCGGIPICIGGGMNPGGIPGNRGI